MEPAPVPLRPAFTMTINKGQGHTLIVVGVWLEEPTFTHGQLYFMASMVADRQHLRFAIDNSVIVIIIVIVIVMVISTSIILNMLYVSH